MKMKPISAIAFTKIYLKSLRKACPGVEFETEEALTIKASIAGKGYIHYLDNAFAEYRSNPTRLRAVVSKYAKSSAGIYTTSEGIEIDRIVPVIKPVEYLSFSLKGLDNEDPEKAPQLVHEKYNDRLVIVYAEDTDTSLKYLSQSNFAELNIDKEALFDFSLQNLERILPDIERFEGEGFVGIMAGGTFEASLILSASFWTKERFDVDGDFVVAIPSRDLLFVTGSNRKDAIGRIKSAAVKYYNARNYTISPHLFIRSGDRFVEYKAAGGDIFFYP